MMNAPKNETTLAQAPTLDIDKLVKSLASELKATAGGAIKALELLDKGATVPFIARYRKEVTGQMDEEQLRQLEKRVAHERQLAEYRLTVWTNIQTQGKLTSQLVEAIEQAATMQEIEDLYLPYRPKRRTRASIAREKGLEPLADMILGRDPTQRIYRGQPTEIAARFVSPAKVVASAEEALAGARDIVAEYIAEDAEVRRRVRREMSQKAVVTAKLAKGAQDEAHKYEQYYDYHEPVSRLPPHRCLALNRGEKEGVLSVGLDIPLETVERTVAPLYLNERPTIFRDDLGQALTDSLKRLVLPSVENEVRTALTEKAETHAIQVFAANLRQLLLQPPIQGKVVLGIDPGFRTGCKIAVVDPTGKPLANTTIYPHEPRNDQAGANRSLRDLISRYRVEVIAIGNGTASRETEVVVADLLRGWPTSPGNADPKPAYVIVSEAGASVYSASETARQEFPDLDVTQRGNISIARRLQDPLAELVKVEPRSIGVGLYQHDVNQKTLEQALAAVVESVVNFVGVDLNTASASLLGYVSGINKKVAGQIVTHRNSHGPFKSRIELKKVAGLGERTFEQAAGFLKIPGAPNPLDNTFIHPESYEAATRLLRQIFTANPTNLKTPKTGPGAITLPWPAQVKEFRANIIADPTKLSQTARELGLGEPTLKDIVDSLEKPGRDPREELPKPLLRQDVLKLADLTPGMILTGTVRNVVDFGAFVDIGLKQDGLVHITEMGEHFIRHPLEVVGVGDIVEVRILGVDAKRGRVSLSLKKETVRSEGQVKAD